MTIARGCSSVGGAAHELGHAIGLWHEHSRPDRDQYIQVHLDRVNQLNRYNFDKISWASFLQTVDLGYDIQSILHYGAYGFGTGNQKTITIREGVTFPELNCSNALFMGQRIRLSYKDKKRASRLYGCNCESGVAYNYKQSMCC